MTLIDATELVEGEPYLFYFNSTLLYKGVYIVTYRGKYVSDSYPFSVMVYCKCDSNSDHSVGGRIFPNGDVNNLSEDCEIFQLTTAEFMGSMIDQI